MIFRDDRPSVRNWTADQMVPPVLFSIVDSGGWPATITGVVTPGLEKYCATGIFDFENQFLEICRNFRPDIHRFDTWRNTCSSLRRYENGW